MGEITTQIEIDAAPTAVWDTLTNFAGYAEWNPSMEIAGRAESGERLKVTFTYPNQKPTTVRPTVLVADAPTDFRWQGRLFVPGLYDGEHRFVLAPLQDGTRTQFTQAETFGGILVGLINRRIGSDVKAGFEAMNEALKRHVEETGVKAAADPMGE